MAHNGLDEWETIKVKADLLCLGVRSNEVAEAIYRRQNPEDDFKTGNVGLHISMVNGSHVLVTASHSFDNSSPYSIDYKGKQLVLLEDVIPLLENGCIRGMGFDAAIEGTEINLPQSLLDLDNVVLTPNIGYYTPEAKIRQADICISNIKAFMMNNPTNIVN